MELMAAVDRWTHEPQADYSNLVAIAATLARKNSELSQFARLATHDLSAPLRNVSTYANLLAKNARESLTSDAFDCLQQIGANVERMNRLLNSLVKTYAVGESSRRIERVNLTSVVRDVVDEMGETLTARNGIVTLGSLPEVYGDASQLYQLFHNLLENAVKYCREEPIVHVSGVTLAGGWKISVADNGIGIAPEHREVIFEMFRRLHTWDEAKGSGLGLSMCQKIVEQHGGKIWVTNSLLGGSDFRFTLREPENVIPAAAAK